MNNWSEPLVKSLERILLYSVISVWSTENGTQTNEHGASYWTCFNMPRLCYIKQHILTRTGCLSVFWTWSFLMLPTFFPPPWISVMSRISSPDHLPVVHGAQLLSCYTCLLACLNVWNRVGLLKSREHCRRAFIFDDWEHVFEQYNNIWQGDFGRSNSSKMSNRSSLLTCYHNYYHFSHCKHSHTML